jgi:Sulfotransferase family
VARVQYLKRFRHRVALRRRSAETGHAPAPFVVGAPRSGTTMLRLMLDAHPDLAIPPETYFIPRAVKAWRQARRQARRRRQSESPLDAFVAAVTGHVRWPDFHLDADAYRERLEADPPRNVSDAIRGFYEMYMEKADKSRWGDKTPFYVRKMDTIHQVLPEARFVHLIRDGRAVTLSIKDLWFGPDTIEEAAEFWVARIDEGREQARNLPHYMELRYEDLVREPEPQLRRICEFAEIDYDERMLRYHELVTERVAAEVPPQEIAPDGRVVATEERLRIMENVSKPPDPSRIDRWKTDMPDSDQRTFERIAGERLRELGYPVG